MSDPTFYDIQATLDPRRECYVERTADKELVEALVARKYSFILSSRKVGKSSLLKRSFLSLRKLNIRVAYHELSIGTAETTDQEQWYLGVATGLVLDARVRSGFTVDAGWTRWWEENKGLPPMQRLTLLLREFFLARTEEPWVVAIDEIDTTIPLRFTDDFFAGIRWCYNGRSDDPLFQRLTFLLVGVAGPTDLIKDPKRTPFNIGTRVEVADFTAEQASKLLRGLDEPENAEHPALKQVLHWTDGHPYLTQRVFYEVARALDGELPPDSAEKWSALVDRVVEATFFKPGVFVTESHFKNIAESRVETFRDRKQLLKTYRHALSGPVADDPLSPAKSELKLAGLLKATGAGFLRVSNRIYARVFDEKWVRETMPRDRRRLVVGVAMGTVVLTLVAGYFTIVPRSYIDELRRAEKDLPSEAHLALAAIPGYKNTADELLAEFWDRLAARSEKEDPPEFALIYRLCALDAFPTEARRREPGRILSEKLAPLRATFREKSAVWAVAFSPDGNFVLTGSRYETAQFWDAHSAKPIGPPLQHHGRPVRAVAFSPDGNSVLTGSYDKTGRFWDAHSHKPIGAPLQHQDEITAVAFSPDGNSVLTGSYDKTARFWDAHSRKPINAPLQHQDKVITVAFSPDGNSVLTGSEDNTARLWDVATIKSGNERVEEEALGGQPGEVLARWLERTALQFGPDGVTLIPRWSIPQTQPSADSER